MPYATPLPKRVGRLMINAALITAMIFGSIAIWTVIPVGVLGVAAQTNSARTELPAGPLLIIVLGVPAAMAVGAGALRMLERLYQRRTGATLVNDVPVWRRSLGDTVRRRTHSPLETIITVVVLIAVVAMLVWFFVLAGSSIGP